MNQFGSHDDREETEKEDEDDENEHLDSPDVDDERRTPEKPSFLASGMPKMSEKCLWL